MKWETPAFIEINMSAELGGYQSDFGDRDPIGPAAPRAVEPDGGAPSTGESPASPR
jgi:hypothetical protein